MYIHIYTQYIYNTYIYIYIYMYIHVYVCVPVIHEWVMSRMQNTDVASAHTTMPRGISHMWTNHVTHIKCNTLHIQCLVSKSNLEEEMLLFIVYVSSRGHNQFPFLFFPPPSPLCLSTNSSLCHEKVTVTVLSLKLIVQTLTGLTVLRDERKSGGPPTGGVSSENYACRCMSFCLIRHIFIWKLLEQHMFSFKINESWHVWMNYGTCEWVMAHTHAP